MTASHQAHPIDMLTAALGGRRVYTLLWALWLFVATIAHYTQAIARSEVISGRTKTALAICIVGFVVYSVLLLRGVSSEARRKALFSRQSDLPSVSATLRVLVWTVAFLALGAALAPAIIR